MTFSGPADLCTAVRDQVEAWQTLGLAYFTQVSKDEIQKFENTLSNLKEKKYELITCTIPIVLIVTQTMKRVWSTTATL